MKNLVLLCVLAGVPLAAAAANEAPTTGAPGGAGTGMGMKGHMGHGGMGQGAHHPSGPPAEFQAACQGKKAGDKVTVTMPHGQMEGSCQLMFRPDRAAQGQPGETPAGKAAPKPVPR